MNGIQVKKEHYFRGYDTLPRFISYFYQFDLIRQTGAKNVLEVGIGNKTLANCLKSNGIDVTTCDFDKNLKPDKVGDIRNLPFRNDRFDAVVAFEVLEHMPFSDFKTSIKELWRVSRKYVIISIPYSSLFFEAIFNSPRFLRRIYLHIPYFFLKPQRSIHHYWEMGRKGYSTSKIRKMLKSRFRIIKEVKPYMNVSHHFFMLEKKDKEGE